MPENKTTLIFAYRAERGIFNALSHTMHRVFSPATYKCRLCQITFSAVGMLHPWKAFLESRPEAKLFYHRKEFTADFPEMTEEPPLILASRQGDPRPQVLLYQADIESCADLNELILKLEHALASSIETTNT
jgi:hypothetical protein